MYYEVLWVKKQVVFLFLIHINSSLNKGLDNDHGKYYGKCSSIAAVPFELNGIKLLISQVNGALGGKENSFHPLRCCFMYDLLCFRTLFFFRQEDTIIKMIVATVLLWSYRHSLLIRVWVTAKLSTASLALCSLFWFTFHIFDLHWYSCSVLCGRHSLPFSAPADVSGVHRFAWSKSLKSSSCSIDLKKWEQKY